MTEEKSSIHVRGDLAILSVSVPKQFGIALDELSKAVGLPKNKVIEHLIRYAVKKLLEEIEAEVVSDGRRVLGMVGESVGVSEA